MNGDKQQLPPDQNQAGGQWQFRPEGTGGFQPQPAQPAQPSQSQQQPATQALVSPQQQQPVSDPTPDLVSAPAPSEIEPTLPEPAPVMTPEMEISWTASEYIAHSKSVGWYLMLLCGAIVLAAIAYAFTNDMVSTVLVVIVAVLALISSARKPKVVPYRLGVHGLIISNKLYPYSQFRSFSIMEEGAFSSIVLMPMKRFIVPLSIYYAPEDEARIVDLLSQFVPMEKPKADLVDNLARRLRF
jgi:hypothetical protein